jgi:1,6-anhydro-N-acetylmuramate kinase
MPEREEDYLATAHWHYIKSILETHGVQPDEIEKIGFHYKSAFIHGYGHEKEKIVDR